MKLKLAFQLFEVETRSHGKSTWQAAIFEKQQSIIEIPDDQMEKIRSIVALEAKKNALKAGMADSSDEWTEEQKTALLNAVHECTQARAYLAELMRASGDILGRFCAAEIAKYFAAELPDQSRKAS